MEEKETLPEEVTKELLQLGQSSNRRLKVYGFLLDAMSEPLGPIRFDKPEDVENVQRSPVIRIETDEVTRRRMQGQKTGWFGPENIKSVTVEWPDPDD